jgi:hypothetical protein
LNVKPCSSSLAGTTRRLFKNEFGFRAHENGTDLQHPFRGGEAERNATRLAQYLHELRVRQGVWRRDVHRSFHVIAVDQPSHGRNEVVVVNPRHELPPVTCTAPKTMTYEAEKRVEDTSSVRTQGHCRPKPE